LVEAISKAKRRYRIMSDKRIETHRRMEKRAKSLVGPSNHVTEEMINFAKSDDARHFASTLNAMMRHGYCRKCKLVPEGCKREGCGVEPRSLLEALHYDPFDGDFRTQDDKILKDKIVTVRKARVCGNCLGPVAIGEKARARTDLVDGEIHSYTWCEKCCEKMAAFDVEGYCDRMNMHSPSRTAQGKDEPTTKTEEKV
jgi:hypothetical protein